MNERIRELKDRAWATCEEPEQYMDKFAELLVQECAKLLDEDSYLMPELGGYAHDMRKMFGVEK